MFSERALPIAFTISLLAHGVILFQNPNFNLGVSPKAVSKHMLEVNYLKNIQETVNKPAQHNKQILPKGAPRLGKEPFLDLSSKITAGKVNPPPFIDKEDIFKGTREISARENIFTKPAFSRPEMVATKKKISLPPIDLDKIDNPSYISYYQIVREKIRRAAYQDYSRAEVGEVYLSFLISQDGSLKTTRLVEEKSSFSPYLREVAMKSIQEASPFPVFPKELDYPQLSFNVVISFEIE
jgi:TonB family protein